MSVAHFVIERLWVNDHALGECEYRRHRPRCARAALHTSLVCHPFHPRLRIAEMICPGPDGLPNFETGACSHMPINCGRNPGASA